jgi:peptidylprolyl isomerase
MAIVALAGCGAANPTATPQPTATRVYVTLPPPPTPEVVFTDDHLLGAPDAYLTVVMYGDFQCGLCADIARSLRIVQERYPGRVRLAWRHFPQASNDKASLAAQAAEAAAAQGKFWEMHDQLLAGQAAWRDRPPGDFRSALDEIARRAGVPDMEAFGRALDGGEFATKVDVSAAEARGRGLQGVPALLFNNRPYAGRPEAFALDAYTRLILLEERQYTQAQQPPLGIDLDGKYTATLTTDQGEVQIELFPRAAPAAVNSFVFLARAGWYDGNMFFLVTDEFVQTGDPSDTGLGNAGYVIIDEHDNGLTFDREGMVAMHHPRGVENSATGQFFITLGPLAQDGYNKQFTIFGRVTAGMDVLRKLKPRQPFDPFGVANAPPGDRLRRVAISESRGGQ